MNVSWSMHFVISKAFFSLIYTRKKNQMRHSDDYNINKITHEIHEVINYGADFNVNIDTTNRGKGVRKK